ncbi:UDP-glucoronosyl and UDP-glucosyl transferase [Chitinophaga sp. CF118]|nr:UDP-glucoronosyl and UDP-glucosyl transferase [Chitinophaga sp. CF118]
MTNGRFGGVLLSIRHGLPIVAAGAHEGKNEICARAGFFKYGINLNTETPSSEQLRTAVAEVMENNIYSKNIRNLSKEFQRYNPNELSLGYIGEILNKN